MEEIKLGMLNGSIRLGQNSKKLPLEIVVGKLEEKLVNTIFYVKIVRGT